ARADPDPRGAPRALLHLLQDRLHPRTVVRGGALAACSPHRDLPEPFSAAPAHAAGRSLAGAWAGAWRGALARSRARGEGGRRIGWLGLGRAAVAAGDGRGRPRPDER